MLVILTGRALLLNLVIVVAVMSLFTATMTLPGFAGLALSVGMSVDANVLINERLRAELRAGLPAKTAIATGYDRASGTIFDSNMTALLSSEEHMSELQSPMCNSYAVFCLTTKLITI